MSEPPPVPETEDPSDLGFRIRPRMVPWLSPKLLAHTAVRVFFATTFGSYSDKREIEAGLPDWPLPSYASADDLWIDYVADIGDAFGTTFSIASLLAEERLDVPRHDGTSVPTKRGSILVLGGDEVYPTPSIDNYNDRTIGPYRATLPWTADNHPHLYAIPGNHDWYDGLTSFLRIFCRRQWIGGRRTCQSRSYFAVELSRRWWLWGIDVQLDAYIDEPQLQYFREAAEKLRPGDPIILCSALPSWVRANSDEPEAYAKLDYFERELIRPKGGRVMLSLTGDSHHYARYEAAERPGQKITAGGGGAFLAATHHLPEELELPPKASRDRGKTEPVKYVLRATFPDPRSSRVRRARALLIPFLNWSFWVMIGAIHLFYLWSIQAALRGETQTFGAFTREISFPRLTLGLVRSPLALVATLILVWGLAGFTKKKKKRWKWLVGAVHALAHVAAVAGWIWLTARILDDVSQPTAYAAGFVALVGVGGGLLGSLVMSLYLIGADLVKLNSSELFAAQRMRTYKCFLRLHIGNDGVLTVHPVGLHRTIRRWRLNGAAGPGESWFVPKAKGQTLAPVLIEEPIPIDPRSS